MAKISSYPSDANVTTSDRLIGSDNENSNETKNFEIGDIINLAASIIATANVDLGGYGITTSYLTSTLGMFIDGAISLNGDEGNTGEVLVSQGAGTTPSWTSLSGTYVPYTGATGNVNLGTHSLIASVVSCSAVTPNGGSIYLGNIFNDTSGIYVPNGQITTIGDAFFNGNGTIITVDDNNQRITFVGGFSVSGNEGTAGQVLTSNGAGSTPNWVDVNTLITSNLYKGNFYDSITQTLAAANTATPVILNNTDAPTTNGISIVTDGTNLSRITFANAGVYNILFSAQLANSGGSSQTVDFWLRKNGSTAAANIAHTNGKVQLQGNASFLMAAWNYFVDVAAGDYIQLVWAATSTNITMVAAAANGVHPETPSIIVTANVV
jgi:hypothetical protein